MERHKKKKKKGEIVQKVYSVELNATVSIYSSAHKTDLLQTVALDSTPDFGSSGMPNSTGKGILGSHIAH